MNQLIKFSIEEHAIAELSTEFLSLRVTGLDDKKGIAVVHKARIHMRNLRVAVDKHRKKLGTESREYIKEVNATAAKLIGLMEPIETHLTDQESIVAKEKARIKREAEEKAEAARKAEEAAREAKLQKRLDKLAGVNCMMRPFEVESMDEDEFLAYLEAATKKNEERIAAEAKQKRLAKEEAERQQVEAARLAKEKAELEAERERQQAERDKIEADRQSIEDKKRRHEEKIEADRLESERIKQAEVGRLAAVEQAKIDERNRIEAEAAAKKKAEEAAEAERLRQEAMRPDLEKLLVLSAAVRAIEIPALSHVSADNAKRLRSVIVHAANRIEEIARYATGSKS